MRIKNINTKGNIKHLYSKNEIIRYSSIKFIKNENNFLQSLYHHYFQLAIQFPTSLGIT
jgi:hypothetical protein